MSRRVLVALTALVTATATPALAGGAGAPSQHSGTHHSGAQHSGAQHSGAQHSGAQHSGAGPQAHRWVTPPRDGWAGRSGDPSDVQGCDALDPAQCLLPYPNDWFTRPDPTSATGRRLDLPLLGMPRNVAGKPIDPREWNRSDGFSAGAQILTVVPGMTRNADLAPSGLPPVTDLGMNGRSDLGVVLLDEETGRRWPVWVEVDQYTANAGLTPAGVVGSVQQDLMIHPAVNLADGHRYIVALRHLVRDDGRTAPAPAAFAAYRDRRAPASDPRRAHMERLFTTLAKAGVSRKDLYLAWDFTTASTRNVTGRLLAIRDDAFRRLGDSTPGDGRIQGASPTFTVDAVSDFTKAQNSDVARRITGHFDVPCYIAPTCEPPAKCDTLTMGTFATCPTPGQFALDPRNPDATPTAVPGQVYRANFICNVGRSAYAAHRKLRPVEYGHGLFGGAGEVNSDAETTMANRHGMVYCATDWFGMASFDVPNAAYALTDLSLFPFLTDRVQEGELAFTYLARLLVHPRGFAANAAFQWPGTHTSFLDTRQVFYDGNSQGGIYGGTVCAISIDVRRCTLGVPGMDYSVLLPRSSDYVATGPVATGAFGYSTLFDNSYPDQSQRMLVLDLLQTLWDRSDPNGYATHMTGGLPHTPTHEILLQAAYGDHQVANVTAETEARTIGARGAYPQLVPGRYGPYRDPFWGIPPLPNGSWHGSAIVLFDSGPATNKTPQGHLGTNPPPTADIPNRAGEDPHEAPRRALCGQEQKSAFLSVTGAVTLPCGGGPYFSWGWNGAVS